MYDHILVPTDGSDASAAALDQAVAIADRFGARVEFLHVVDVGVQMSASAEGTIADELTTTLESVADDALTDAEARANDAGVDAETTILEGVPHDAIVRHSADSEADLVVMGVTGRSGVAERLLGSTTERVVRAAETSVLVARTTDMSS
ncbi:MAG: universal stress protein [Halohasta sp.]